MLSQAENERLSRVGPGTPGGNLLRRYWHPIAGTAEMRDSWTKRVRLLGEDLVLFKNRSGAFGLIAEACPHRRASMAYGIPEVDGIRCPYHGWKFDASGHCIEQPNEPAGSTFKDKCATTGYPVQELGGLLWGYLGPLPAPLIPRLDGYVVPGTVRMIGKAVLPCNWLQIMENSHDPVHTEWLHGHLQEFVEEQRDGVKPKYAISRHHVDIAFEEFEYGIYKRRLMQGQSRDADDWRVGHPVFFPTTLAVGAAAPNWHVYQFQIRTPIDDENTLHLWYEAFRFREGTEIPQHLLDDVPVYDVPYRDANGEFILDLLDAQDIMAWITQGATAKRDRERLGWTDRGVIMLRKMLEREIAKVESGVDPMGVIRDPAKNVQIDLPVEVNKDMNSDGVASRMRRVRTRYAPHLEELLEVFARAGEPVLVGSVR
jgi:5,5'-dehydrodivanillate O-demethylase